MASEAPPFWWEKPDWRAWALSPLSALYGFGGAQDEHNGGECGAGEREQRAANAHLGEHEQTKDDIPELFAVAFDGEGPVQMRNSFDDRRLDFKVDRRGVDKSLNTAPEAPQFCQQKSRPEAAFRNDLAG